MTPQEAHKTGRVVLLGWYGSDNTGDEALLEAVADALRARGITNLHALSINPEKTTRRFGIPSSPRKITDKATLRALRGADALVLGGGGLIQDRTSVYNLPIYAFYTLAARLLGLTVIGWGLGVEPLDTQLGKWLARFIVGQSKHFSVRDSGSKRLLVRAGVPPERVSIGSDPAFLISPNSEPSAPREQPHVVFCMRDLPDNRPGLNAHYVLPISVRRRIGLGGRRDPERERRFVEAVARGVQMCIEEFGAQVQFLMLWPGRDDDAVRSIIQEAEQRGVPPEAMSLAPADMTPKEMAQYLAGADLLVSMRLHALIFAARGGVPSIALAYARKMRSQMRALGMERWVVEVENRTPPAEEITMKLHMLWDMRKAQGQAAHEAAERLAARANSDADAIAAVLKERT